MNLLTKSLPTPPTPTGVDASVFDAATYSDWVRWTIHARQARPDSIALFDSTISEPTTALFETVRSLAEAGERSRFVSVFDGGNPFVVEAIAKRYGLSAQQIIPTTGTTSAMAMALKALVEPGDGVLIETPGFDLFNKLAADVGAVVEPLPRPAPTFHIDLDDLARKLIRRAKVIILSNLHNPSGALLCPSNLQAIAAMAEDVGAVVLVDEVYADFAQTTAETGRQGLSTAGLAPNVLAASSLTKVFGLFSLKCGWLSGQAPLIERIRADAPDGDMNISKLSHAVAAHVLENAELFDAHWRTILRHARPVLEHHANHMRTEGLIEGDLPDFGCMYFPKIVGAEDTGALTRWLWDRHGLLVAKGEYFGTPGHIRLGFGYDAAPLDRGLTRLSKALTEWRTTGR